MVFRRVISLYAGFLAFFTLTVLAFWLFGSHLFAALMQLSRAYTPPEFLTWLSLIAGLSTAVAFCLMPIPLFRIVRRRADVPFGWVVLCIAGFLLLCGLSAFVGLLTIWFHGPVVIWSLVLARVGTALLTVATLLVLRALVPEILKIPTRAKWLALNNDLLRIEADAAAKDKLLALVGHELRTPLAPLLATLTELDQQVGRYEDPAINESIRVLRKNILREARLVSDLLDRLELPTGEIAPPAGLPREYPPLRRLLLVEDHEDTLRTFARLLRKRGFEVAEASSVSGAIKAWQPGDLLLSDIGLPDGDGRDLMRQLGACGVPGIAVSGFGTAKDREEFKRAGFAESFVKPVDVDQLVHAINRITTGSVPVPRN